jgi:hypothetical protein
LATRHGGEGDLGEVLGDAQAQDVDRDTGDDVVDPERHGGERMQQAAEGAADRTGQDARPGIAELERAPGPGPGAQDHHALEADVDHAGPLGPQSAETGQADRHGQRDGGVDRSRRGEVDGAGDGAGERQQEDQAAEGVEHDLPGELEPPGLLRLHQWSLRHGQTAYLHADAPSARVGVALASCLLTRRCSAETR